jgi:hypothetical protein
MHKIILFSSLLILLAGCTAQTEQQSTLTTTEITPASLSTATTHPLPSSTKTPSPTIAIPSVSTPTRTAMPSPTADLAATVVAAQQPSLYASYPSPDGKWRMDILIYNCVSVDEGGNEDAYEQLLLVDLADGEAHLADEQLQSCGGLGAFGFEGRYWSPESTYFYYTNARQGVPDGCGYWEPPLSRIEIAAPHMEYLGMGSRSPDGEKITTWDSSEQALVIWDINGGEIARLPAYVSNEELGPIAWSPDSQSLVYLQVNSWCPLSGYSYLVLVDSSKPGQSLLIQSESPTIGGVEWDTKDELRLVDADGKEWRYNLPTKELIQVP